MRITELLVLYEKNSVEITDVESSHRLLFGNFMESLKEKDEEIIEKLYESLKNIKDINSYGQKILKSYRVFESYSDIERQELTKSQDMVYVTEQIDVYDSELKLRKFRNNEKKDIEESFSKFNRHL